MALLCYKSATWFKISLIAKIFYLFIYLLNPMYNKVSLCLSPDNYLKSLVILFSVFPNNINPILHSNFSSTYT